MTKELELEKGSGNAYRDLGLAGADSKKLRIELAVEIIRILKRRGLSLRQSAKAAGLAHPDIAKLKNGDVQGFTIDRLVTVLNRLDRRVEVKVSKVQGNRAA